jgi:2-phosphosulfolactate phosphatase
MKGKRSRKSVSPSFPFIELAERVRKPRHSGLTMVMDKGMGTRHAADLIETAASHIDIIKLGWGTSGVFDESVLREKIRLYRDAGIEVLPGGTFLEVAFDRGCVDEFFRHAKKLGFSAIEVSNGIHPKMNAEAKQKLIRQACKKGFYVTSEVGRKMSEEDLLLTAAMRVEEARADLEAGALKVVMESRESGTVGIFNADGKVNSELAQELFQKIDPDCIIWEAPRKQQQVWLINQLGSEVNIGNVPPEEVISLETLRLGLRGDTFREHRRGAFAVYLELGIGGALRAQRRGDIVVMVDALRASTTIAQALVCGARSVVPVVSADELSGEVTAGERGGMKLPNADYSNSPLELKNANLMGRELVLTTTNGTECIKAARGADNPVLIGSVTNSTATAGVALDLVRQTGRNLTLLAAGRNNLPAIEDRIGITEILKCLDAPIPRGILEPYYSNNIERDFLTSDSGINLSRLGYVQDVIYCSQKDIFKMVPVFDGHAIRPYEGLTGERA